MYYNFLEFKGPHVPFQGRCFSIRVQRHFFREGSFYKGSERNRFSYRVQSFRPYVSARTRLCYGEPIINCSCPKVNCNLIISLDNIKMYNKETLSREVNFQVNTTMILLLYILIFGLSTYFKSHAVW